MYEFEQVHVKEFESHTIRQRLPEQTIFQSPRWISFLVATQRGEPMCLLVSEHGRAVGYFTGMIVTRLGFRILGSPFPGWSTGYMGFNLAEGVERGCVLREFIRFAFHDLRCVHTEVMDRSLVWSDMEGYISTFGEERGYEIDLRCPENQIFSRMTHQCRTNIRKASRSGVIIEEAADAGFADEYYDQLLDVFSKQKMIPTYPKSRVKELVRTFAGQPGVVLLRARDRSGLCIASAILLCKGTLAYLWGAASYRHSQFLRPNELLYWTAIQRARELGMNVFDMGGDGEYKRKYGGTPICVPWLRASRHPFVGRLREIAAATNEVKLRAAAMFRVTDRARRFPDSALDRAA